MFSNNCQDQIISFFEKIEQYYGCKTEITEGLNTDIENSNSTTWNLSEFTLIRAGYRINGDRFMIEGKGLYYEISAKNIIDFKQLGRNKFEFIEEYGSNVYRVTTIAFNYKY